MNSIVNNLNLGSEILIGYFFGLLIIGWGLLGVISGKIGTPSVFFDRSEDALSFWIHVSTMIGLGFSFVSNAFIAMVGWSSSPSISIFAIGLFCLAIGVSSILSGKVVSGYVMYYRVRDPYVFWVQVIILLCGGLLAFCFVIFEIVC